MRAEDPAPRRVAKNRSADNVEPAKMLAPVLNCTHRRMPGAVACREISSGDSGDQARVARRLGLADRPGNPRSCGPAMPSQSRCRSLRRQHDDAIELDGWSAG